MLVLAAVRGKAGIPDARIVVASRPTHAHLVSCLAGGATAYLARPLDLAKFARELGRSS